MRLDVVCCSRPLYFGRNNVCCGPHRCNVHDIAKFTSSEHGVDTVDTCNVHEKAAFARGPITRAMLDPACPKIGNDSVCTNSTSSANEKTTAFKRWPP